jgi:hypothetical protein
VNRSRFVSEICECPPPARDHHSESGHFALDVGVLFLKLTLGVERKCDFDQLGGHGMYRIGSTLAAASLTE